MTRLSKDDWNQLDDLLGKHGFGGYYDLVECLKLVGGDLGISLTGIDYSDSISLPQMVQYLQDWAGLLGHTEGFDDIADRAANETEVVKGK